MPACAWTISLSQPDRTASPARPSASGHCSARDFVDGGVHPRFGTRNMILPLAGRTYLEVVEVLDHPASDKAPFGQAVRARSALGGGWLGWVVAVDDITGSSSGSAARPSTGNRHRPDGTELLWQQIGVNGLIADPQLPFFIAVGRRRPSCTRAPAPTATFSLASLEIAGDPQRVSEWLGETVEAPLEDVKVEWVAPHGTPGIIAAQVQTPHGPRPDLSRRLSRPPAGRRPEPEHLAPPRDLRAREPRRRPRRPDRCRDGVGRVLGRPRPSSTSAAAPASTCRAWRRPRRR